MELPGVPETISREDYQALMESLGLELKRLRTLEFRRDGIYATYMASDAGGKIAIDPQTREVVEHRIYIPVED